MALICIGCSFGHLSNALTLYGEAMKFERTGDLKMRDLHLTRFMGEIRQAEEQNPFDEQRKQIRELRKRVESAVASNQPLPDIVDELGRKGVEILESLRAHPELCPTCKLSAPEVEHV
jgi:uncharacterized NAD(P)/FAD-binding protein YdhS